MRRVFEKPGLCLHDMAIIF